jgi:hypothetical protein
MRRLRFSIASMLILVLFVAVAIAALREATDMWDSGVFSLTLALLLVSALMAVHRADRRRAYWMGFALFGSAYLGASLVPPIESRLLTTKALAYLAEKVPGREGNAYFPQTYAANAFTLSSDSQPQTSTKLGVIRLWDATTGRMLSTLGGTSENFTRIGHSLLALVLAFVAGHISRSLFDREIRQRGERPADSSLPGPTSVGAT